jgi:eukaryotic-like serine/threonine-protein kinase
VRGSGVERVVVHEDVGRLVAGRYRLQHPVGEGGMGVVWRALDERLDRVVAVKQLRAPSAVGSRQAEQERQRVLREARIAARLQHPHAVGVHDVIEDASGPLLVMEYLPARSLAEVLAERGALPPQEVAHLGAPAAAALAAAHAAGIVHRDVKPGNILLGHNGTTKITDFGISHAAGDVTVTSTGLLGTPAFLAPEVARGEPPGPASDVFSLGATLYAAVEGAPPFGTSENPIAQLHRVAAGGAPAPLHAGPLTGLLVGMLRDDPASRPSMSRAAADLQNITAGDGPRTLAAARTTAIAPAGRVGRPVVAAAPAPTRIDAQPVRTRTPSQAGGRLRRHPGYAIAGLVGCLLLALLVAVLLNAPRDRSPSGAATAPSASSTPAASGNATTASQSPAAIDPGLLQQAVSRYYALLPDHPDQAWTRLGPALQSQGQDAYDSFWHAVKDLRVVTPPQADGNTVTVTIGYRTEGHDRVQETHELGMILTSGTALINTDRLVSSQTSSHGNGGGGANGDNGGG